MANSAANGCFTIYEKGSGRCSEPGHIARCPLPRHALRNGRLNQTVYSLFLFMRDVAGGGHSHSQNLLGLGKTEGLQHLLPGLDLRHDEGLDSFRCRVAVNGD